MERKELLRLAKRVLTIPTAPYHEHGVQRFVIDYCRQLGLRPTVDRWGNVICRYMRKVAAAPLALVAHMDHPGFEALGGNRAEFLGGVPRQLLPGGRIRFFTKAGVVRAKVRQVLPGDWRDKKALDLVSGAGLRKGDFGMWDVPAFQLRAGKPSRRDAEGSGQQLHACAIDDVLSVVVVLATLTELVRRKVATHLWGVFTRAEEVGFHGAVEVARTGVIPKNALVISMEMSKERPWARQGDGPVIRVGDRLTMFDPQAAWFMMVTARQAKLTVQRALMDGGACEATAFAGFDYRVGGLCIPLGNYHNIGPGMKPRAEYVNVNDLEGLVKLTVAAAREWRNFTKTAGKLHTQVMAIRRSVPRRLVR